jgi:hypothetical protein
MICTTSFSGVQLVITSVTLLLCVMLYAPTNTVSSQYTQLMLSRCVRERVCVCNDERRLLLCEEYPHR